MPSSYSGVLGLDFDPATRYPDTFRGFVGPNRKMMEQYAKTGHNGFLLLFPQFIIQPPLYTLAVSISKGIIKQSNKLITLRRNLQKRKVNVNWSPPLRMSP
jgi:hypothetical protein